MSLLITHSPSPTTPPSPVRGMALPPTLTDERIVTAAHLDGAIQRVLTHALRTVDGADASFVLGSCSELINQRQRMPSADHALRLAEALGGVAHPLPLLFLLYAGCRHQAVEALFRDVMVDVLGNGATEYTPLPPRMLAKCGFALHLLFPADSTVARLIMTDPYQRRAIGYRCAGSALQPSDLAACLGVADFMSAAEQLVEHELVLFAELMRNPALTAAQLSDALTALRDTPQASFNRVRALGRALSHGQCDPSQHFPLVRADDWREVYAQRPALLARLWKQSHRSAAVWSAVFCALLHGPQPLAGRFASLANRVRAWGPNQRLLMATLLASSREPVIVRIGHELRD